jgi:hypothetical protein
MLDLTPARSHDGKFRKDWGLQNVVGMDHSVKSSPFPAIQTGQNADRQRKVRAKIARFVQTAIYPQQLTVPRQYATTSVGTFIYKIMEGREIDGFREKGVRVIVQENLQQARFVVSPLFGSKYDALDWARQHMGAEI